MLSCLIRLLLITVKMSTFSLLFFLFRQRKVLLIDRLERNASLLWSMTIYKSEGKQFPLKTTISCCYYVYPLEPIVSLSPCCHCGINSRDLFSLVFKFVVFMHLHICIYLNNVVSEIGHVKNFSLLLVPWDSV